MKSWNNSKALVERLGSGNTTALTRVLELKHKLVLADSITIEWIHGNISIEGNEEAELCQKECAIAYLRYEAVVKMTIKKQVGDE